MTTVRDPLPLLLDLNGGLHRLSQAYPLQMIEPLTPVLQGLIGDLQEDAMGGGLEGLVYTPSSKARWYALAYCNHGEQKHVVVSCVDSGDFTPATGSSCDLVPEMTSQNIRISDSSVAARFRFSLCNDALWAWMY